MEEKINVSLSGEDKSKSKVRKKQVEVKKFQPIEYKKLIQREEYAELMESTFEGISSSEEDSAIN